MACTCKWRYEEQGNVKLGYRDETCQECLDSAAVQAKEEQIQQKAAQIRQIELDNLRKIYDGEDIKDVNTQRLALRAEIQTLTTAKEALTEKVL